MTHPLKDLESALPALKGTPAELVATCAVTRLLSEQSCMFSVTPTEMGLIARAMGIDVVGVTDGAFTTYTVTVEDDGVGVVFQTVQGR
jgi:putative N-acetylmannosamine-6-phosphate epimerase